MTVRLTLRLPEPVYNRIAEASRDSGRSLNQVVVDALRGAELEAGPGPDASDFEKLRWAARNHAPPWTDEDDALMAQVFPDDDPNADPPTREELWAMVPELPPEKWLSKAVIEDREESEDRV